MSVGMILSERLRKNIYIYIYIYELFVCVGDVLVVFLESLNNVLVVFLGRCNDVLVVF